MTLSDRLLLSWDNNKVFWHNHEILLKSGEARIQTKLSIYGREESLASS